MRIGNNISAMNALNRLNYNRSQMIKSLERLSSGSAINRAADDAAGLAISERMRAQLAGLEQACKNAQDGISLVQTAEGALDQIHTGLRRLATLATKAASGTITLEDRMKIQAEVDTRIQEIDRVAKTANYNGIKLFDGSLNGDSSAAKVKAFDIGAAAGVAGLKSTGTVTYSGGADGLKVTLATSANGAESKAVWDTAGRTLALTLESGASGTKAYSQQDIQKLIDAARAGAPDGADGLKISIGTGSGGSSGGGFIVDAGAALSASTATTASFAGYIQASKSATYGGAAVKATAEEGSLSNGIEVVFANTAAADAAAAWNGDQLTIALDSRKTTYSQDEINALIKNAAGTRPVGSDGLKVTLDQAIKTPDAGTGATVAGALQLAGGSGCAGGGLTLQIGATAHAADRMTVFIGKMDAASLFGSSTLDMSTPDAANDALKRINSAIEMVSSQRAGLGATENRLEATIENLTTTMENLSAAESRIRDVDMAKEMANFTKYSILTQIAQAMLAQANALPQGVLRLLS